MNSLKAKIYKNVNHRGAVTSLDILVNITERADEDILNELQDTVDKTLEQYKRNGAVDSVDWFGDSWRDMTGIVSFTDGTSSQQITGICTRVYNECSALSSHYVSMERYNED